MEWKSSAYHVAVAGVLQYTVSNTTFLFARKSGKGAFDQIFTQAYAPRFLEQHYAREVDDHDDCREFPEEGQLR